MMTNLTNKKEKNEYTHVLMSKTTRLTLHLLPVELVYRILDHLKPWTILCSMRNVCTRLNQITDSYQRYQNLTELNFSSSIITAEQWKHLANALCNNNTIITIIFNYQQINNHLKAAKVLTDVLQYNTSITTLNLYHNQIGDKGAKDFASALRHNATLTVLDLSSNEITSKGVQHLANALQTNRTLIMLNLSVNHIDSKGAQYLSKALKENETLNTLDLSLNHIGHDGGMYFADVLKYNKTLMNINLRYNGIGSEIPWYLRNEMETNPSRVKI